MDRCVGIGWYFVDMDKRNGRIGTVPGSLRCLPASNRHVLRVDYQHRRSRGDERSIKARVFILSRTVLTSRRVLNCNWGLDFGLRLCFCFCSGSGLDGVEEVVGTASMRTLRRLFRAAICTEEKRQHTSVYIANLRVDQALCVADLFAFRNLSLPHFGADYCDIHRCQSSGRIVLGRCGRGFCLGCDFG